MSHALPIPAPPDGVEVWLPALEAALEQRAAHARGEAPAPSDFAWPDATWLSSWLTHAMVAQPALTRSGRPSRARRTLRRSLGSFATPVPWAAWLVGMADAQVPWRDPAFTVVDPACGAGALLVAAARHAQQAHGLDLAALLRRGALRGWDIDAAAVRACRCALALLDPLQALSPFDPVLQRSVVHADPLIEEPDRDERWSLVVLNPPYLNAIEGEVSADVRTRLRARWPELGGTTNLAGYFMAWATDHVEPDGAVAMLVPRALLQTPALDGWRSRLGRSGPSGAPDGVPWSPRWIHAPSAADLFDGADVHVALVVLGPAGTCAISTAPEPFAEAGSRTPGAGSDWWQWTVEAVDAQDLPTGLRDAGWELRASLTTGDAYALKPFIRESGEGQQLHTTGLIDPDDTFWGRRMCRYLGEDYARPVVPFDAAMPSSLRRNLERSRRPKVLVAGLSRCIEAAFDADGAWLGAVSTWSIYHPHDDAAALHRLMLALNAPWSSVRLRVEQGAAALSGGNIPVSRAFLSRLLGLTP
jgi:hypothetical protein